MELGLCLTGQPAPVAARPLLSAEALPALSRSLPLVASRPSPVQRLQAARAAAAQQQRARAPPPPTRSQQIGLLSHTLTHALSGSCATNAAAAVVAADAAALDTAALSKAGMPGRGPNPAESWRTSSVVARGAAKASGEPVRRAHARVSGLRAEGQHFEAAMVVEAERASRALGLTPHGKAGLSKGEDRDTCEEKTDTSVASSEAGSCEGDCEADLAIGVVSLSASMPATVRGGHLQGRGEMAGGRGCTPPVDESDDLALTNSAETARAGAPVSWGDEAGGADGASVRALLRVRERRRAERAAVAESEAAAATSEQAQLARAALAKQREEREIERAQIYAINRLVAAHQEGLFNTLVAERADELRGIAARHQAEIEERREAVLAAAILTQQRLRARATELSREAKDLQAKEREATEAKREAQRQSAVRAEERQERRAQIYAINALLAQRDALEFEARFGVPPPDRAPAPEAKPAQLVSPTKKLSAADRRTQSDETVAALSPCKASRKTPKGLALGSENDPSAARGSSLLASPSSISAVEAAAQAAADAAARRVMTFAATQKEAARNKEAALAQRREFAREKGEEKEIFRAQVYALNKLMRAREEENFRKFKAKVEAEVAARIGIVGDVVAEASGNSNEAATLEEKADSNTPTATATPTSTVKKKRRKTN